MLIMLIPHISPSLTLEYYLLLRLFTVLPWSSPSFRLLGSLHSRFSARADPIFTNMNITTSRHPRPARAVGYPAQGRGADGGGGRTAGTPSAGVVVADAEGSHTCESPHLSESRRSSGSSNHDPSSSLHRQSLSPGPSAALGTPASGPGPADRPSNFALKKRSFRIGTWNMNGRFGIKDGSRFAKLPLAEDIMAVEKVDILVLTETHTLDLTPSLRTRVLGQTGVSDSRGGVAIIARSSEGWTCNESYTLVDGYAILVNVTHHKSTESFWILGVYGNISSHSSLESFYQLTLDSLTVAISPFVDDGSWAGCLAAGDWNMVSLPSDRIPTRPFSAYESRVSALFDDLVSLCSLSDAAGPGPSLRGWTHKYARGPTISYARLDRIYRPMRGWSSSAPVAFQTNWSDHRFVWSDCIVNRPRVELAKPAARLPAVLDKIFWTEVDTHYDKLCSGPIALPAWSTFKKNVLSAGIRCKSRRFSSWDKDWSAALRGNPIPIDMVSSAIHALARPAPPPPRKRVPRTWRSAAPELVQPPVARNPRHPNRTIWASASAAPPLPRITSARSAPLSPTPGHLPLARSTSAPAASPPPAPPPDIPAMLSARIKARRSAIIKKMKRIESAHTSEWFNLSSNKEVDERGSRASISVDGLRLPGCLTATSNLKEMAGIARSYFVGLHSPEPPSVARDVAQTSLLHDVRDKYADIPPPEHASGPFSREEFDALSTKMPNTAPGPDGIQYSFWKSLSSRIKDRIKSGADIPDFRDTFLSLTNDLRLHGSDCLHFKDANISMFFKKGDPTLAANYRPISSMNTDCKMYTNLINSRLQPWACAKIHPDQKGFIPFRYITEHTRLATAVAHMASTSGTNGYILSLDQAKAYDRVDQFWLLRVLRTMGLDADLVSMIADIIHNCRSRVRINGGYSRLFSLRRGVRQGDPLSCLLFNFAIEPLAMRLRHIVSGFHVPNLPPVRVIMYADDTNLFLSASDDISSIKACLDIASFAIGSKFNHDKSIVKAIGSHDFQAECHASSLINGQTLPDATFLSPEEPLRVLGVWVGPPGCASHRWLSIEKHIRTLTAQWSSIGTSVLNRVLLAKALMQSRCFYLLDGNSIPLLSLRRINSIIMRFVRGRNSCMTYNQLEAPLALGGVNCPSLITKKRAYDLKFLGDLISGDSSIPWKRWTLRMLLDSTSRDASGSGPRLHPFLQLSHTGVSSLHERVKSAFATARFVGIDVDCCFPSRAARLDMPWYMHPAVPRSVYRGLSHLVSPSFFTVRHLRTPPTRRTSSLRKRARRLVLSSLALTRWWPTRRPHNSHDPQIRIWPSMVNPEGCIRFLTAPYSLLSTSGSIRTCAKIVMTLLPARFQSAPTSFLTKCLRSFRDSYTARSGMDEFVSHVTGAPPPPSMIIRTPRFLLPPVPYIMPPLQALPPEPACPWGGVVNIWTDGSASDNGHESCVAGSAWITDFHISDHASLRSFHPSNNLAEVVAVIMALQSWPTSDIHIHTDSTFVLGLIEGSLLALERDGWLSFHLLDAALCSDARSHANIFRFLLYLLRSHVGRLDFSWVKGHSSDHMNRLADELANEGRLNGRVLSLNLFRPPPGWVDESPVLNGAPLHDIIASLTSTIPAPLISDKFRAFRSLWYWFFRSVFSCSPDFGLYYSHIWSANFPAGFRNLIWKDSSAALPIGHRYHGPLNDMRICPCSCPLSLPHILSGCDAFPIVPLYHDILLPRLRALAPSASCRSVCPDEWSTRDGLLWFPLLCLKFLEYSGHSRAMRKQLNSSRSNREWAISSFFWAIWKYRMKLIHEPPGFFSEVEATSFIEREFTTLH